MKGEYYFLLSKSQGPNLGGLPPSADHYLALDYFLSRQQTLTLRDRLPWQFCFKGRSELHFLARSVFGFPGDFARDAVDYTQLEVPAPVVLETLNILEVQELLDFDRALFWLLWGRPVQTRAPWTFCTPDVPVSSFALQGWWRIY